MHSISCCHVYVDNGSSTNIPVWYWPRRSFPISPRLKTSWIVPSSIRNTSGQLHLIARLCRFQFGCWIVFLFFLKFTRICHMMWPFLPLATVGTASEHMGDDIARDGVTGDAILRRFLDFYSARGHKILPSSTLIPDDPTVLLTIAGMLQFKPIFLGKVW